MKRPIFRLDRSFEAKLLATTAIGELLQPRTAAVARRAKQITRYRSISKGISATVGRDRGRFVGRVVGDDFKTGWAEFGTSKFPQERALGRALEEIIGPMQRSR